MWALYLIVEVEVAAWDGPVHGRCVSCHGHLLLRGLSAMAVAVVTLVLDMDGKLGCAGLAL